MGILNSSLLNWYFKLISSNNHINNYEIDEFPIPIGYSRINEIGLMVKEYLEFGDDNILLNIDKMVNEAFGLNEEKKEISSFISARDKDLFSIISTMKCDIQIKNEEDLESFCMDNNIQLNSRDKELIKNIFTKYKKLEKNILLNHITFKLSDLDMEMIINIPQGGNWKNIPDDVIKYWDISLTENNSIKAYIEPIENNYKLFIISPNTINLPIGCYKLFSGFQNLEKIEFNNISTSTSNDFGSMFYLCSNLENILGLEQFDTKNIKVAYSMFAECRKLTELN